MDRNTKTGQLRESRITDCPVFIPKLLIPKVVKPLLISHENLNTITNKIFEKTLKVYFYKFFAGNQSLTKGFADVLPIDLFLWSFAKVSRNIFVKNIINTSSKYSNAIDIIVSKKLITKSFLIKRNQFLRPKSDISGIRKKPMRAGDPKYNKYAFYCTPVDNIDELFDDLIRFLNSKTESTINKSLIVMIQFIFIHPFKDGNGRTSRALFLAMMQPEYGMMTSCLFMLYLKNINRMGYYSAMHDYRNGDVDSLKQFYLQTIDWVNQSSGVLNGLFDDYAKKIGVIDLDQESEYTQVVVLQPIKPSKKLDKSIFEFHSKKGENNVFINNALLSIINQLDYYLRSELRKHNAL